MSKLYPPKIERTLPAFIKRGKADIEINIPFQLNPAVSIDEVNEMSLLIKNVQTNTTVISDCRSWKIDKKIVQFFIDEDKHKNAINIGQYYKVQIAFVNEQQEIGYYSDIGIIKCTTEPEVNLTPKILGSIASVDIEYSQKKTKGKDPTEQAYSFKFDLIDNENNNIIESSGEIFYDHFAKVDSGETFVHWQFSMLLEKDKEYKIKCTTTTINSLVITKEETITQNVVGDSPYITLIPSINPDDGCIKVDIKSQANFTYTHGYFDVYRTSETNNFKTLECIYSFVEKADTIERQIFDYSVEQGVKYKYYIQEHNENKTLYSAMIETETVLANFEDIFISDSKRQLCIKFNPKVSSFKSTILESKMDTLGGQYPFFFRNGNVNYKEFSISGLISLLVDENELFMEGFGAAASKRTRTPSQETGIPDAPTQLTKENFYKERRFKLEVLNWLNNGEPKLFRSPAEGNYIVRLMNVSLSPNETLGRMLHTFNATAYEMAECDVKNLKKYNLIKFNEPEQTGVIFGLLDSEGKALLDASGAYLIPAEV